MCNCLRSVKRKDPKAQLTSDTSDSWGCGAFHRSQCYNGILRPLIMLHMQYTLSRAATHSTLYPGLPHTVHSFQGCHTQYTLSRAATHSTLYPGLPHTVHSIQGCHIQYTLSRAATHSTLYPGLPHTVHSIQGCHTKTYLDTSCHFPACPLPP